MAEHLQGLLMLGLVLAEVFGRGFHAKDYSVGRAWDRAFHALVDRSYRRLAPRKEHTLLRWRYPMP